MLGKFIEKISDLAEPTRVLHLEKNLIRGKKLLLSFLGMAEDFKATFLSKVRNAIFIGF